MPLLQREESDEGFGSEVLKGSTGAGLFAFTLFASLVDCFPRLSCLLSIAFHVVLFAFHCFPVCFLLGFGRFFSSLYGLSLYIRRHDTNG